MNDGHNDKLGSWKHWYGVRVELVHFHDLLTKDLGNLGKYLKFLPFIAKIFISLLS